MGRGVAQAFQLGGVRGLLPVVVLGDRVAGDGGDAQPGVAQRGGQAGVGQGGTQGAHDDLPGALAAEDEAVDEQGIPAADPAATGEVDQPGRGGRNRRNDRRNGGKADRGGLVSLEVGQAALCGTLPCISV